MRLPRAVQAAWLSCDPKVASLMVNQRKAATRSQPTQREQIPILYLMRLHEKHTSFVRELRPSAREPGFRGRGRAGRVTATFAVSPSRFGQTAQPETPSGQTDLPKFATACLFTD